MRVAVFIPRHYDRLLLERANVAGRHRLYFPDSRLDSASAAIADDARAVCACVNNSLNSGVLQRLRAGGVRLLALRSAGFNHVDLTAVAALGIAVGRAPEYSPYAVAENTVALLLALNRCIHRAYNRVHEGNFALEGLFGFDLYGRTVGVVDTCKIDECFVRIMAGFGCRLLGVDP